MGLRLLEVLCYRERGQRRETRLLDMLKFIHRWLRRCMGQPEMLGVAVLASMLGC